MPTSADRPERGSRLATFLAPQLLLLLLVFLWLGSPARGEDEDEDAPGIKNPYYEHTKWRVWRDDDSPVKGVPSRVLAGKKHAIAKVTIKPVSGRGRIYPVDPPKSRSEDPYIQFKKRAGASKKYAGVWDDVYTSWSALHGYVRERWQGPDGSSVSIFDQIMHSVSSSQNDAFIRGLGVNFVHQSTTGMAHDLANGYSEQRTLLFQRLYFSDCLVTSPAHASFTDWSSGPTSDLYMGHVPTLFNSVGSSYSETMAITKMIIAGGYLPPETKLLLKRSGLYPAAMLYLWKAALPYDVPYDHELRHRIAYKSVGNRFTYPSKYGAAGIDRGDASLEYHQYDDEAHMRGMVDRARSMDVALPEALFTVISVDGGEDMYRLRKSAVIVQEKAQDITLSVSTEGCYDLQGLPLTLRWKLLYGNKQTTIEPDPEEPHGYTIRVPWDEALPQGRTAIALIANNGRFDSNPAIVSIYRQRGDLPPGGGYKFPGTRPNLRPVLLDVQDQYVKRGKEIKIPLHGIDPEGFPLAFYKRAGEVGEIDGDLFTWRCPKKTPKGSDHVVTIIASDETSGNSYNGRQITIHVDKPKLMARIEADTFAGPAPLKVKLSAKDSIGPRGKLKYGWAFYQRAKGRKAKKFKALEHDKQVEHTFDKPGFYEVALTVQSGKESDTQVIGVLVTKDALWKRPAAIAVEGNGLRIASGDAVPSPYDHTEFGAVPAGKKAVERTFRLVNIGDWKLALRSKKSITFSGPNADRFRVVRRPRSKLEPRGSTNFTVRFTPKDEPVGTGVVEIHAGEKTHTFTICAGKPAR